MSHTDPHPRAAETATFPPAPEVTADFAPGGDTGEVIAGRYTLLERIGEGGMGEVWVAKQTHPVQRKVAVKLIKAGMDSKQVVARFEAERQALALMDHPNIAKVLDGGLTERGRPFFVMELVNGLPLTKYCDEVKLTLRERLQLFQPVCQAIQHAHQKGIVHRDIKPTNLLVTLYDAKPVPKVIDFGVAKATGGRLTDQTVSTQFGAVVGTFEYMAPEQAGFSALDVDTRADIYSLGVILYELLTGLRPFEGSRLRKAALDEMFRILREEDPPRPSTKLSTDASLPSAAAVRRTDPRKLAALMRGELDWIVMKCLEKDRTRRYESASALARDIERYLTDEPVEARPPSAGYKVRKFARRNKGPLVGAGLVLLALVAGVIGTMFALVEARDQRDAAVRAEKQADDEKRRALGEFVRAEQEAGRARAAEIEQGKEAARARAAEVEQGKARAQAEAALTRSDALRLGSVSANIRAADPGLALLLGLESVRRYPHHLTYTALYDAAADLRERRTIPSTLYRVGGVRLSPDGSRALAFAPGGSEQSAAVIDLATGTRLAGWSGFGTTVEDVEWSPDGARAVSVLNGRATVAFTDKKTPERATFTDRVAYIWDTTTGRDLVHLRRHDDRVVSAKFSPDGTKVLTASWDGKAKLWDAVSGKELHTFGGHENALEAALFSPDGRRALTVSSQQIKSGHQRDYGTGKYPSDQDPGADPGVTTRPYRTAGSSSGGGSNSPRRADDPFARLWDAETGKQVGALKMKGVRTDPFGYVRHRPRVAAYSPDGAWIAVAFDQELIGVWDAAGGEERFALTEHKGRVMALAFSPDGVLLASAGDRGAVHVWDLRTGQLARRLEGHGNYTVTQVRFSADGRRLLSVGSGADRTVRVWHVSTGRELAAFRGHDGEVTAAHFLPGAETVLTGGDQTLRLWSVQPVPPIPTLLYEPDPPSGRLGRMFGTPPARHQASVTALAFSPDGKSVVTGSADNSVRQWDAATGKHTAEIATGLRGDVTGLGFGPGGAVYLTTTMNTLYYADRAGDKETLLSMVHRWDPARPKAARFLKGQRTGVAHMELSADGRHLLLVQGQGGLQFQPKARNPLDYQWAHDSQSDGQITVWDTETATRLCALPPPQNSRRQPGRRLSPDGATVVYPTDRLDELALYDARTGQPVRTLAIPPWGGGVANPMGARGPQWDDAQFSPDGRTVVARRSGERVLWFWEAATGTIRGSFVPPGNASGWEQPLAFSPDSKRLAVGIERVVHVMDVSTRTPLHELRGHVSRVTAMAFSPDGDRLLTGSEDTTAALWDVAGGHLGTVYRGHPGAVNLVAYSPDGTRVATASAAESLARVWPVNLVPEFEKRKPRELTAAERVKYELPPGPGGK